MNNKNGFALIEILIVVALISILSAVGVVTYNGYISNAQDKKAQSNFNQIVKTMNNELANCRINPSARVFNNHNCDSNSEPGINAVSNFFNSSTLTNPYDKNEKVVGSNLCNKGTVAISSSNVSGSYQVQYVSQKKDIKYTKIVESKWSSEKTEQMSKEETYKCTTQAAAAATTSAPKGSISNYKVPGNVPWDGYGSYIVVDKNGKMTSSWGNASGCTYSYCGDAARKNGTGGYDVIWDRSGNNKPKKGEYVFVLIQASRNGAKPGTVMNSAVPFNSNGQRICTNRDCTYNFSDNTFTDDTTGQVFEAGSGKRIK